MANKLTDEQKVEALNNALKSFSFNEKYYIHKMNKGANSIFLIVGKNNFGGLDTYTSGMTYEEMNAWLKGYYTCKHKPI